ncbi:MAG: hypothetical protein HYU66_25855 [Armatimonadetes bacterium]|nr:hypothetical protein [Armatimonadota bacterium]
MERRYFLDLCFQEEELRHYRIDSSAFSYHYLAEDGRLTLRRDDNFVTFVGDIVAQAGEAWVTPACGAMARGEVDREAVVRDLKLFDAEQRWRLQVLVALGPPAAGGESRS